MKKNRLNKYLKWVGISIVIIGVGVGFYTLRGEKDNMALLFSGIASLGVICTILYQISSYQSTVKTASLQRFEASYFNMLGLQQQIINELESPDKDCEKKGRALFEYLYKDYGTTLKPVKGSRRIESLCGPDGEDCGRDSIKFRMYFEGLEAYDDSDLPTVFDHYFRHLYRIVKFIDNPNHTFLTDDDRYTYAANLRGTLSKYELVWLYYNCLAGPGFEKFKPLVEKYALFKNIRPELLGKSYECKEYYYKNGFISNKDLENYNDFHYYLSVKDRIDNKPIRKYHFGAFYTEDEIPGKKKEFRKKEKLIKTWIKQRSNQPNNPE